MEGVRECRLFYFELYLCIYAIDAVRVSSEICSADSSVRESEANFFPFFAKNRTAREALFFANATRSKQPSPPCDEVLSYTSLKFLCFTGSGKLWGGGGRATRTLSPPDYE